MRYHSLDNLRAILMLLGVVLHAACSYVTFPLGEGWPFKDRAAAGVGFDLLVASVHAFRMPLFFVLAGFFAHLLYERRGADGLVSNRVRRILVPFVVGWLVLYVPTFLAFAHETGGRLVLLNTTMHLWFLNDLLWFYAASLVVPAAPDALRRVFRSAVSSPLRVLAVAPPTVMALWFMKTGVFDGSTTLMPEPHTLVAYGLFYAFGWMLWRERDVLDSFRPYAGWQTLAGFVLVPVMLAALLNAGVPPVVKNTPAHLTAIVAGAVSVWLIIFGLIGLCLKYVHRPGTYLSYLANASYWVYLVHLPIVIWLAVLLKGWAAPGLVKFSLIIVITTTVLLTVYEYVVRRSVVGAFLNGSAGR